MKKLLIIFSYKYPFSPPVEQFLHMEMPYHSSEDTDIWFVPYARDCSNEKYDISEIKHISIKQVKRKKRFVELFGGVVGMIGSVGNTYLELNGILHKRDTEKKVCLSSFLRTTIQSQSLYREIKATINIDDLKDYSDIVLYSYWLNPMATAICFYKQFLKKHGFPNVRAIARAHGQGDLYLEPDTGKYRPNAALLSKELNRIYSISQNGMNHLKEQGLTNVEVSRLGVKKIAFPDEVKKRDRKLIISCSVINSNKRVIDIAKAISQLNMPVSWVHFGSGSEENALLQWCKDNMPQNIEWKLNGWTLNKDVLSFYLENRPDTFVNLSYVEGIPVSIMEAMSCGIPCVATDTGASSEIVENGVNGFLVSRNLVMNEVTEAIRKCLGASSEGLKRAALKTATQKYCAETNFQQFSNEIWKLKAGEEGR